MMVHVDPYAAEGGVQIVFEGFDAFMWATRPGRVWPASALQWGRAMSLTVDAKGDLIDSDSIPEDATSNEVSAFIEDALRDARSKIDELLTIEERKQAGVQR